MWDKYLAAFSDLVSLAGKSEKLGSERVSNRRSASI
jgi:hypothetical protein